MRLRLRYFVPILLLGGLVALFAAGLHLNPTYVPSPFVGKPAPRLDLPILLPAPGAGKPPQKLTTRSLLGHPVLVNFFASWCVGCHEEHEYLLQLAHEYHVPIIGIDYKDRDSDLKQWLDKAGDPYRLVAVDRLGNAGINWGLYGVPETFVLDAQGVIRYKQVGPMTPEAFAKHVQPILEGKG